MRTNGVFRGAQDYPFFPVSETLAARTRFMVDDTALACCTQRGIHIGSPYLHLEVCGEPARVRMAVSEKSCHIRKNAIKSSAGVMVRDEGVQLCTFPRSFGPGHSSYTGFQAENSSGDPPGGWESPS